MGLQRKGILWHDLLVSSEERRLTGQMNIGRMNVHRSAPILGPVYSIGAASTVTVQ